MARIDLPAGDDLERTRMWQMAPQLAEAAKNYSTVMFDQATLSIRERELARMRVARINACPI